VVVILGFGAFAVAMNYATSERNLLQATVDAAALTAATKLPNPNRVTAMALLYVQTNTPAASPDEVVDRTDVRVGNWDPVTETWSPGMAPMNAVKVTLRQASNNGNRLELFLAPILDLLDIKATAVAAFQVRGRIIGLARRSNFVES